jgi:hypothetical protein
MRWLSLWLCVMLAGQYALAQETLTDDPRLQPRITLWLKMEPLRDVLRTVSKQTGVSLRCQDAIQHHKVSIFVENRPAGEILTQLASLFRYAWRKDGEAYVLYVPDETRLQEEGVLRAGRAARVRALQDVIRFAREALKNPPADTTEFSRAPSDDAPPEEWNRRLVYWYRPWMALQDRQQPSSNEWRLEQAALLAILAQMPPQAEQALLNGQLVGFSTRPALGVYRLPEGILTPAQMRGYETYEEIVDGEKRYRTRPAQTNPELWGVWMRLPSHGSYLECELVSIGRNIVLHGARPQDAPELYRTRSLVAFHISPYVRDHAWLAQWREWATPSKEWEARVPERALTSRDDRPKPSVEPYPIGKAYLNSADLLEWFAWSTRLPIIAESFRTDNLYAGNIDRNAPRSVLRALSEQLWIRTDESGYVLCRSQWYWGKRLIELPEDWLRPLEQRFAQKRWLDLEDYITLAARMNEQQADYYEAINSGFIRYSSLNPAIRFPFETVVQNLRGLRFLASLSASQRRQLQRGEWIPAERLTLPQRQRFQEALGERFPPPERLMVVDSPYRFFDDSELRALGSASPISTAELAPVERAAFRLQFTPEKFLRYEMRSPDGVTTYFAPGYVKIEAKALPGVDTEELLRMLQRQAVQNAVEQMKSVSGSQMYLTHTQGYTLELQAPPAQRKIYYIFQQRAEPVDVRTLEAKLKEVEKPNQDTQANGP